MMWGGYGMWMGGIGMVLFWVVIIAGLIVLVKPLFERDHGGSGPAMESGRTAESSRAEAILEERYARGEISADEFRSMKAELRESKR